MFLVGLDKCKMCHKLKRAENLGPQDPWSFTTVNITNALLSTKDSFRDLPIPMFIHLKSLLKCYSCRTCHNPPKPAVLSLV